jgi:hypothetical protein
MKARETGFLLWGCLALFAARVLGQLQTVLVAPDWLPDMDAWFSGLLPYHLLLPAQIGILMLMTVVAWNPRVRGGAFALEHPRVAGALRIFAFLYFVVMAVRLAVNINTNRADFWSEGAIPVAFHWVLALFILVAGRQSSAGFASREREEDSDADDTPHGDVPALAQPLTQGFGKQA